MGKPFVIIMPEAEREALRKSGVLPEGFFRSFDVESNGLGRGEDSAGLPPVYLWPYDLRYNNVIEDGGEGLYKPDVPGFFGMDPPVDDAAKMHNERLIASLLGCVMVHVVFLDEQRRQGGGYAVFESFEEIVTWGESLRKALNVRFRNEMVLQSMESVLVIVARKEQVSLREADVRRFNDCVCQYRGDVYVQDASLAPEEWQRKVFKSCYFLDYNLCVRDSRELYHSAEIWDVMVGRLILAFMLSRKGRRRWWQVPGIKLWRSLECAMEVDANSDKRLVDDTMAQANLAVQNLVADTDSTKDISLFHVKPGVVFPKEVKPLAPEDAESATWRDLPSGGWSEYDTQGCVSKTCGSGRWAGSFKEIKQRFAEWKSTFGQQADYSDIKSIFRFVHFAPGNLLVAVKGVCKTLCLNSAHVDDSTPRRDWESLVSAERARRAAMRRVEKDAPEMESAQRHYVGLGVAALIVASVCAALGLSVYYLLHTIFSLFSLKTSALLVASFFFVFIVIGSAAAALLMVWCHSKAGRRAHSVLADESKGVDDQTVKKDDKTRAIVVHGMRTRDTLIMRSRRFRAWALLKRTQDILLTELHPAISMRTGEIDDEKIESRGKERRSVREAFLKRTRNVFGPYHITMKEELRLRVERLVASWWSENAENRDIPPANARNFSELWHALCAEDQELTGYFPARLFSREIRTFVARFTEDARMTSRMFIASEHVKELRDGLLSWYERLQGGDYYLYASGAVTGEHVNEAGLENARVYFADCNIVDMDGICQLRVSSQADQSRFMPEWDPELNQTRTLALLFQEIRVKFGSDAESDKLGHLVFEAVSDLAEDQNG